MKCTSCGARWRAFAEAAAEPQPEPEPDPAPELDAAAAVDDFDAEAPEEPQLAPEDVEIVAEPAPALSLPPRKRAAERRSGRGVVVGWIAVAATAALVVGGAVVFRDQVVGVWPGSAQAYAGVGLPVDRLGLVIGQVKAQPTFQGGRPVLSVTGAIRNTRAEAVTSPSLRISLMDKTGRPLAAKLARPLNAEIPAGGTRYFAVAIADPPSGSHDLEITFETEATRPPPGEPVEAVLGPSPVEAQPLPVGAPDALPDHG